MEKAISAVQVDDTTTATDSQKDFIDQLMIEEDRKRGTVEMTTFIQYFKMTGGLPFFLLISFI